MLLQFSVTNHRSIKDTAIISLKASTDKSLSDCLISPDEKKQLVPVLALYGANAAGKSNVLHALLLMREMVCGRYAKLLKGESLPQEPFAFTDQPTQPTSFEAIYFYGGIKYAYGFSFDKSKVLTEYLYHWPNGREALIFSRENNGYQFRENIQEQFTLAGRTAENRLYAPAADKASDRDGAGCRYQYKPCTTHLHHARYRTSRPDVAAARSDLVCRKGRKDHADRYLRSDRVFSTER